VCLLLPVGPLAVHILLGTPPSGLMIIVLWAVFIYSYLWRADVRAAFRDRLAAEPSPRPSGG